MLLFKQLEFPFQPPRKISEFVGRRLRLPRSLDSATEVVPLQSCCGRDLRLEEQAREIFQSLGAARLGSKVRVEWNARLRSAAGRADARRALVTLNPRLHEHGAAEIYRTFRHELAHLLAQFRVGRRRVSPHGPEWRAACRDLGIAGEGRCHNLAFPVSHRARRFLYRCPNCGSDFPRMRRIRRAIACLACCRERNRGKFDSRFRLHLVESK